MSVYLSRANAVRRVMPKEGSLQSTAIAMAMCGPHAVDYVVQAPVMAVAAIYACEKRNTRAARAAITADFAVRVGQRPKLRDLMALYGIAYPFRRLRGEALTIASIDTITRLSSNKHLKASALAQAVPETTQNQAAWLHLLVAYHSRLHYRCAGGEFFEIALAWAASAFNVALIKKSQIHKHAVEDLADFYVHSPSSWNLRWDYAQAKSAELEWHADLARTEDERSFRARYGVGYTHEVDYAPLPLAWSFGELEFSALRSGDDLFSEGRAMHHCVASYINDVILGLSRIYSLRRADCRIATIEFRLHWNDMVGGSGHYWKVNQVRGPCNATPVHLSQVLEAVDTFCVHLNKVVQQTSPLEGVAA